MHAHHMRFDGALFRTARSGWKAAWLGLAIAASALLGGCGGGGHDDVDDGSGVATPPPSVSATIGADGGTLVGPDDVRVEIPAGALSAPTTITVTRTAAGAPALPASAPASAVVYEFTPHGLRFDLPATISMPSAIDPAVDPVLMAEPGEPWQLVQATAAAGRLSWSTTHFSWTFNYPCGASYPPGTPLPPNGPDCQIPSSGVDIAATPSSAMVPVSAGSTYARRIVAAADVVVTFRYRAPLGCVNPRIRTWRVKRPATLPTSISTTPVALTTEPVPGIPGAIRRVGSTDIPYRFEFGDNGTHETGYFFNCEGGLVVGGSVLFVVQVPQPPAMPAAPTITAQPANASVATGAAATFDVLATAPDNLVVRWERREPGASAFAAVAGAAPIAGGSRLTVTTVAGDAGAAFRAQVCNSLRGVDNCIYSSVATLGVVPPPPPLGSLAAPSRLSGAFQSACGISATGGVLCWGANGSGELGRGSAQPTDGTPAAATGLTGVTSVGASSFIGCAVHAGGRLSCWGGYPGNGRFETSAVPVQIAGVTDAKLVRVANGQVCTVDGDARVRCLGDAAPLQIDGQVVVDAVDVAFTSNGRCVLLASGDARCATFDGTGALVTSHIVPNVRSLGGVPGFAGLGTPFCVVLQDRSVRCWGTNANGQLGTGDAIATTTDVTVAGIGPALQVAVGTRHACAVLADGSVSCWGSGYLGNGAGVESTRAPRAVSGLAGIVDVTAGYDTTCALRADGAVLCWGDNSAGSIGTGSVGAPVLVPTPTVAGPAFVR